MSAIFQIWGSYCVDTIGYLDLLRIVVNVVIDQLGVNKP